MIPRTPQESGSQTDTAHLGTPQDTGRKLSVVSTVHCHHIRDFGVSRKLRFKARKLGRLPSPRSSPCLSRRSLKARRLRRPGVVTRRRPERLSPRRRLLKNRLNGEPPGGGVRAGYESRSSRCCILCEIPCEGGTLHGGNFCGA